MNERNMMKPDLLSYEHALETIVSLGAALPAETIALEQCSGRALAESVVSPIDLPPWDNAGMDGYAAITDDVRGATTEHPVTLRVLRTIAAGNSAGTPLGRGECARIMTGAPVPPGADCVIRVEDTDRGERVVQVYSERDTIGRGNVRPRGEDVRMHDEVFGRGTSITPAHLGVLASIGYATVRVHRKPRVTLLSSGDELVLLDQFDEVRRGERIVSSSTYALPALLAQAGADVRALPLIADDVASVTNALDEASRESDLVITTGGISVGAHDYTRDAVRALGGESAFWRARIRPGGPIGSGRIHGVPWLGLPGNPVSSMVTGLLFAWPLIRTLGGHARVHHLPLRVRVGEQMQTNAPLTHFLRVSLSRASDGMLEARSSGPQGSNLLRVLAGADALLVVPESVNVVETGMLMDAIALSAHAFLTDAVIGLRGE